MKKLLKLFGAGIIYFSLATVVAQAIGIAYLGTKGTITSDKIFQVMAIIQGVDLAAMKDEYEAKNTRSDTEDIAYSEIINARMQKSLNLSLREQALGTGIETLRILKTSVAADKKRLDDVKASFETKLTQLETLATDEAIVNVQRFLEAMKSKQAKDHILMILQDERFDEIDRMTNVVTIMKSMSDAKVKKILAEFKEDEASKRLGEIIQNILLGVPVVKMIGETREQLSRFNQEGA